MILKKKRKMKCKAYLSLGIFIGIFLFLSFASATEPTYVFSKIFLNPFYTGSTTLNTNTTFTLGVFPPERIHQVVSAIVSFDVWMNPSVNFTLWVNNKTCNNPFYYISTTYSGAGKTQISFDCSNVINQSGAYQIILKSTKDTGAITGWIDLTYSNKPKGTIELSGTEYHPNDPATFFLQLKDENGLAIQNGICYIDVWYPLTINGTHPYTIFDAPMLKAEGDDGLYYYDMTAPSTLGVYMLSSKCSYALDSVFCYSMDGYETAKPNRTSVLGTYVGDPIFLNDFEDWIYTSCSSSGGGTKTCEATYDFDLTHNLDNITNFTAINLYYMGEASAKAIISFSVWNWSSGTWVALPNNLTFSGGATSVPVGIGDFASNGITYSNINHIRNSTTGIMRIKTSTSFGSSFSQYDNWLNIQFLSAEGYLQELKGSGEMHITAPINMTSVAQAVWNFTNRNLTFTFDATNYTLINNLINNRTDVVNYTKINQLINNRTDIVNYTLINQLIQSLNLSDKTNYTLINNLIQNRNDIVNYTLINSLINNRTDIVNYTLINDLIHTLNITDYTNYTLINALIQNRNDIVNYTKIWELIENQTRYDLTNYTLISQYINNRTDIVNYTKINELINNRTDIVNYTLISQMVNALNLSDKTNYTLINELINSRNDIVNYTLIDQLINNRTDIVNYTLINEMVQSLNITDLTNYTLINELIQNRNDIVNYSLIWELIENQTRVDTTNYSLISSSVASSVWGYVGNVSNSIIYAFQTALIQPIASAVWIFTDRNLTYTADATNYSKVAEYVWLYENRNLTFYEVNNISVDDIWSYMNRNLTFYPSQNSSEVAEYVWNYVDRNLTFEQINNISASEIWSYYNRSLTDDIPLQVWNYPNRNLTTDIPFEIWNYENRTLTYYTINLTELIEMIQEYEFNQTPIPFDDDGNFNYFPNYQLNVTLYVIK